MEIGIQLILLNIFVLLYLLLFQYKEHFYPVTNYEIYLINLPFRKDRLATTVEKLNSYGYTNINIFPAVNGKLLSDDEIKEFVHSRALEPIFQNRRTRHHQLSRGAVGCSLSHIRLWEKLRESNVQYFVIFEDDTNPIDTEHYWKEIQNVIPKLPNDWDLFLLGGIYNNPRKTDFSFCVKITSFYCTHAYIIRQSSLDKLLPRSIPIEKQIDSWLSDLASGNIVNIYGLIPNSWGQNDEINSTDIQTQII